MELFLGRGDTDLFIFFQKNEWIHLLYLQLLNKSFVIMIKRLELLKKQIAGFAGD